MIKLEEFKDYQLFDKFDDRNYADLVRSISKTIYKLPSFDNFYSGILLEVREDKTWCSKIFHVFYNFDTSEYTIRFIKYSAFGEKIHDIYNTFEDPSKLVEMDLMIPTDKIIGTWVTA